MTAPSQSYCRSCLNPAPPGAQCRSCGGGPVLSHPELDALSIAHIDCDAFFASVEKRDNPELEDQPVIIGGGQRGVVSTACYIARLYGVRSAMLMFKALKACPDAVVVRPRMAVYAADGKRIRAMMEDVTPLVEPLSIDEAFLDLSGTEKLHGASPAQTLLRLQRRILNEVGVTVSVGLSFNKFLAKTASDLDKPNGFSVLGRQDAPAFLAQMKVGDVYGVGPVLGKKLNADGLYTPVRCSETLRRRSGATLWRIRIAPRPAGARRGYTQGQPGPRAQIGFGGDHVQ